MRNKSRLLAVAAVFVATGSLFLVEQQAHAQDAEGAPPTPPNLFLPLDLPDWQDPAAASDESILCSHPVQIDFSVLDALDPESLDGQPSAPIQFNLLDGVSVPVVFTHAEPRWSTEVPENPWSLLDAPILPIGYTWRGYMIGDPDSYVIMMTRAGTCAANIHLAGVGWFELRPFGEVFIIRELAGDATWECGAQPAEEPPPVEGERTAMGTGGGCGIIHPAPCDDGSMIDLIVLYTHAAKLEALAMNPPRDIGEEIEFAVQDMNAALNRSLVSTEVRLLYKAEANYTEPQAGCVICEITNPWDGKLDEVHALRDTLRADLVCLLHTANGGSANTMHEESPAYGDSAFSQLDWTIARYPVLGFSHELGHNLGCAHDRETELCEGNCSCSPGACDFSFGYTFDAQGAQYGTIMSYLGQPIRRIGYFSNPNVTYLGIPTGVSADSLDCDSAENALTINTTKDTAANFRSSCNTTNTTRLASHDFFALQANAPSQASSISDNGQYLAFASQATNFGGLAQANVDDVFLYNRESGLVSLLSHHDPNEPGVGGQSSSPAVSGNGRFVAFASDADDLIPYSGLDTNTATDIFVWDQVHGSLETALKRVSLDSAESQANGASRAPSITADGRYVAFESLATNLVEGDTLGYRDIFVRTRYGVAQVFDDPADSFTERVSITNQENQANRPSYSPSISAQEFGRYVAFESDATNLLEGTSVTDTNGVRDIFIRDQVLETTSRVSIATDGTPGNGPSYNASISQFGFHVAFESDATNLLGAGTCPQAGIDCNGFRDIFVRRRVEPIQTFRVSVGLNGAEANGPSFAPAFSNDGLFVAFHSDASNLVEGDNNLVRDVFVYHIDTGAIVRVSVNSAGVEATGGASSAPAMSNHGRFIAFESDATNLVDPDAGGFRDIFLRDRGWMCLGDLNDDGLVNAFDLAILLGAWAPAPDGYKSCPPSYMSADLNYDCMVNASDLAILLGAWGLCPWEGV